MPDPSLLSPTGQKMLAELPEIVRGSYDYLAVIHAYAREIDLLEAAIESVRSQFNPNTADVLLDAWEYELKLPVGGAGASTAQRRANVIGRLRKILAGGEGRAWEAAINAIIGPGWSYQEHNATDPSSPPPGVVRVIVPFASGTSQFIQAENQVRDITDAHLELDFQSSQAFVLDQSEMDQQQLGY